MILWLELSLLTQYSYEFECQIRLAVRFFFHFFAQQMGPSLASGNLQDTYSLNSPKKSNGLIRFMQSLNNKKVSKKQVMWAVVVLQVAFFNVNCTK